MMGSSNVVIVAACFLFTAPVILINAEQELAMREGSANVYHIVKTWNDTTPADNANITVTLSSLILHPSLERQLTITVDAPFYDDPHIPDDTPPETLWELWELEVVEVFLLGSDDHYLELEFSPKGQYLLLELKGERNVIRDKMPLYKNHYNASIGTGTNRRWKGTAVIPNCYLPENINKFNAYAIHGTNESRVYMSLFPSPEEEQPNFHLLKYFGDIDFYSILPRNGNSKLEATTGCGIFIFLSVMVQILCV